ncbi:hypothetical protein [Clostridium sp. HV4-5-A1G]|uniref:hypothetical protein n=1 Tax=Clostridium sp. HV4-5-A1G TaxID=2004595 RepID=UPI001238F2EE|nr:hypothetical protein [Clostridium sp. HV4-5-A1G]KAA8673388.1 hypothetical protein F3O63_08845 [Clostridium sp. HV4-5-A1G]
MPKKKQNFQSFQSSKGGRFMPIYFDMVDSKAWSELKSNDIKVYLYMLRKYTAKYDKHILISSNKDNISVPKDEYLGKHKKQSWSIKMNQTTFMNCIDHLIDLGFIKVVRDGYASRECNIYGFSDMWKKYGTKDFYIKNDWKRAARRSY